MEAEDLSASAKDSTASAELLNYADATTALSVIVRQSEQAVFVIYVTGELDMLTGPLLEDHLTKLLAARPQRLVINLSEVAFLGSTGLAVLIGARHTAAQQGTMLQLSGISHRAVARPLQITGLDRLFETVLPAPGSR
jgi:anti-sigma B factor antagonist